MRPIDARDRDLGHPKPRRANAETGLQLGLVTIPDEVYVPSGGLRKRSIAREWVGDSAAPDLPNRGDAHPPHDPSIDGCPVRSPRLEVAAPNHQVVFAIQNGADQPWERVAAVLPVGVHPDAHNWIVSAESFHADAERSPLALVRSELDDLGTTLARNHRSVVTRSIVDDHDDDVMPAQSGGDTFQHPADASLLIKGRHHDTNGHHPSITNVRLSCRWNLWRAQLGLSDTAKAQSQPCSYPGLVRITFPSHHERLGALRIHSRGRIIELDSSGGPGHDRNGPETQFVSHDQLDDGHRRLTIVVPMKNERRSTLRGVLAGIPGPCRVVVISASESEPIDRFALEREVVSDFNAATGRQVLHLSQRDTGLARAVDAAGMGTLVDDDGAIRSGKGEAMVVGMMIADANSSDAIGFIDADNYVPGAVNEYVRIFAATLATAASDFTMGRISWQSKPKIEGGELVFNRWGRSTAVSNRALNEVLSHYLGEGSQIITTGNAGEHMMTMPLARRLRTAGSYAVETTQIVDLMEQFGGIIAAPGVEPIPDLVEVVQTETINPHFHEDKGDDHVEDMRNTSLAAITNSPICPPAVRAAYATAIPPARRYPAISTLKEPLDLDLVTKLGS